MISSNQAFAYIKSISKVSGNTKQVYLRSFMGLEPYLLAAYNPYKKYYITKGKPGKGEKEFDNLTWQILDKLHSRELSGYSAQTIVNIHTEEMTPQSSELFQRILKKDLRFGMGVKSINKVYPGLIPTHDVMLAKLYDANKLKFPAFGSTKIDGVRAEFENGVFYSRGGYPYKGLEHLQEELKNVKDIKLDGELTVRGKSFQVGSGLIRDDYFTPDAEFKLIELPGVKETYRMRLLMMEDLNLVGEHVHSIYHKQLVSEEEVMEFYKDCRRNGFEGAIISPYDYEYKGTRSWNWMKLKPVKDVDLVVVDIYEGKGKYKGQLGGVIVNFKGQPNKVGGGFSDNQRKLFWNSPELIVGKVIEIHYMEETDDGNMRHSRFFDFRPDKEEKNESN